MSSKAAGVNFSATATPIAELAGTIGNIASANMNRFVMPSKRPDGLGCMDEAVATKEKYHPVRRNRQKTSKHES